MLHVNIPCRFISTIMLSLIVITLSLIRMLVTAQSMSYMHDATLQTYEEAKQLCIDNGMVLAQPKTEELWLQQVEFLNDVAPSTEDMWIGLTYEADNKHHWLTGEELSWNIWDIVGGEPNYLDSQKCVRSEHDKLEWESQDCTDKYTCICQSADPLPASTTVDSGMSTTTDDSGVSTTDDPDISTTVINTAYETTPSNTAAPEPTTNTNQDELYQISNVDILPDSGLMSTSTARSKISCALLCMKSECSLFAMDQRNLCKLYNHTALQANWISSPGAHLYILQN